MNQLEIRLLGELAILREGVPVPLPPSRKTRALLGYLVLNAGPQRREHLCELLWQLPDDPRGALRWSLSKLRGLVNGDGIVRLQADREHVWFRPDSASVDLLTAAGRIDAGVETLTTGELEELAQTLNGELLTGLDLPDQSAYHYFLARERQRVHELRCTVLRALAAIRAPSPAEAVPWLRALVEAEPYELENHRRLIESLATAGRRKDAERQMIVSASLLKDVPDLDLVPLQRAARTRPGPAVEAAVTTDGCSNATQAPAQQIRFCRAADGVQIAYASVGRGPPLVKTANWLNHLEYDWESPVWRHVFEALTQGRELIRYDARGNGLSDWDTEDYSFESMVADLEAVVDAQGLTRFPLLGVSQGCAVSVEFAVRHPERVSALILFGGYARGWNRAGSPALVRQTEAMLTLVGMGWGQDNPAFRQMFTSLFMPDAPDGHRVWFNELQRLTTSPDNAARLIRACGEVDVRHRLAAVRAPTLVLHSVGDLLSPFSAGRALAGGIPGARFVSLATRNHLLPADDPAWPRWLREVRSFLDAIDE